MVDILSIYSILVNINAIGDSYVNGSTQPTIYSFFPNLSPENRIVQNPETLYVFQQFHSRLITVLFG